MKTKFHLHGGIIEAVVRTFLSALKIKRQYQFSGESAAIQFSMEWKIG